MPSPSTCEKTVLAVSATASRTPSVQVLRAATGGSGKSSHDASASADAVGSPFGSPVAVQTASAAHIWITVLPGERVPACSSAR